MKSNRTVSKVRKSVGTEIIESLSEFTEALQEGKVGVKLTCRKVRLRLAAKPYDRLQVKKTRRLLGLSQTLFSRFLGVSPNTVQAWEQGVNLPPAIACRFMDEIRRKPDFWQRRIQEEIVTED